ncbi:MAG: hypothetical protein R3C42_00640 [Parvularculaceae bacterium]|nr:hypothetical protein [Parvularculaceae bacterium]
MKNIFLAGVAAGALAISAAVANPAEKTASGPVYEPSQAAQMIAPVAVTTKEDSALLAEQQFAAADSNADGSIDAHEFAAFVADAAKASAGLPSAPDDNSATADEAFKAIAKDDMKISKEELVEARAQSFKAADADGDKALDALEQQRFASLVAAKPDQSGEH